MVYNCPPWFTMEGHAVLPRCLTMVIPCGIPWCNLADSQRRIGYSPLIFLAIDSSAKNRRAQPCAFWTKITAPLFTFIQLLLISGVNSCEIANEPSKNWLLSTNATEELRGYAVHDACIFKSLGQTRLLSCGLRRGPCCNEAVPSTATRPTT